MHGKKIVKKVWILLCASFLCLNYSFGGVVLADLNVSEKQQAKAELQEKKKALSRELAEASSEVKQEATKKDLLDKQIDIVKSQIDNSNEYISKLNKEMADLELQIAEIRESMKEKIKLLKSSLGSIYVAGDASTLDIILGSKNFEDFLDKADIVRSVSQTIKKLIDGLNEDVQAIEQKEAELIATKEEAEGEKTELEKNRNELQDLLDESEKTLTDLEKAERAVKHEIDENDAEVRAIEAQIRKFEEEQRRKREEEERRRREAGIKEPLPAEPSPGGYIWPVPSCRVISSHYGDRSGAVGRSVPHRGLDIAGKYGAEIVATKAGTVVLVNAQGWGGGYGKYVVVSHGNGETTMHAHMSQVSAAVGEKVKQGQCIGYIGSTGQSTGNHLHFEYRKNGIPSNPRLILSY